MKVENAIRLLNTHGQMSKQSLRTLGVTNEGAMVAGMVVRWYPGWWVSGMVRILVVPRGTCPGGPDIDE